MDIPFPSFWQDVFWAVCAVLPDRRDGRGGAGFWCAGACRAYRTTGAAGADWLRAAPAAAPHPPETCAGKGRGMAGGLCRRAVGTPERQERAQGMRQPAARDGPCRGAMPWGGQQGLCLRDTHSCGRNRPRQRDAGGCRQHVFCLELKFFWQKYRQKEQDAAAAVRPSGLSARGRMPGRAACCYGAAGQRRTWGRTRGSIGAQRIRPCRNGFSGMACHGERTVVRQADQEFVLRAGPFLPGLQGPFSAARPDPSVPCCSTRPAAAFP